MNFNRFARPLYFFSFRMTFEFQKQKGKLTGKRKRIISLNQLYWAVLSDLGDTKINKTCLLTLAIGENLIIPEYYVLMVKLFYCNSNTLVK